MRCYCSPPWPWLAAEALAVLLLATLAVVLTYYG
jgi:hypothetical protein